MIMVMTIMVAVVVDDDDGAGGGCGVDSVNGDYDSTMTNTVNTTSNN